MYSGLPADALAAFQAAAAPFVGCLGAPLTSHTDSDEHVRNEMREVCRATLGIDDQGWPVEEVFRLRKVLETAVHLGRATDPEWQLLWEVFEALRGIPRCRPPTDKEAWTTALDAAVCALNHSPFRHSMIGGSREEVVARAFIALKRKGYTYTLDGRGPLLTPPAIRRLCAKIEDKIERAGGLHTANAMLDLMRRVGRVEDGSLLHARTPSMTGLSGAKAGTPWHYIYNLALKHLATVPRAKNAEPVLTDMENLARDFAAASDVEPHSSYENMSIAGPGLSGFIHEVTLYDELFAFPQWQPLGGATLIPLWLDALDATGCPMPGLTRDEWKSLGSSLVARSQASSIEPVSVWDLVSRTVSQERAAKALNLLSHEAAQINRGYQTPFDTVHRTGPLFPILWTSAEAHFVQPRGVATRAFCERLYTLMRGEGDADLENKMGKALERLTIGVLAQFGIRPTIVNKHYAGYPTNQGPEVDIAVETEERIFLFECTKKPLTNDARGGATLSALRDIEGSFLKLVQQLARHEAELRTRGEIRFTTGEVLELKGRSIEKIGVNLFDHGSLQNRDFTIALIEALAGAQISAASSDASDVVKAFNKRLDKLNQSLKEALKPPGAGDQALFKFAMSTWWLSVDQLYYLLAKGEGDLWGGLHKVRHLTARSGDLVHEVKRTLNLNEVGRAMLDVCEQMDNRAMI